MVKKKESIFRKTINFFSFHTHTKKMLPKDLLKHSFFIKLSLLKRCRSLALRRKKFIFLLREYLSYYLHLKKDCTNEELTQLLCDKKTKKILYSSLAEIVAIVNELEYANRKITGKLLQTHIKKTKLLIKNL